MIYTYNTKGIFTNAFQALCTHVTAVQLGLHVGLLTMGTVTVSVAAFGSLSPYWVALSSHNRRRHAYPTEP